jgi:hypothetical protein
LADTLGLKLVFVSGVVEWIPAVLAAAPSYHVGVQIRGHWNGGGFGEVYKTLLYDPFEHCTGLGK